MRDVGSAARAEENESARVGGGAPAHACFASRGPVDVLTTASRSIWSILRPQVVYSVQNLVPFPSKRPDYDRASFQLPSPHLRVEIPYWRDLPSGLPRKRYDSFDEECWVLQQKSFLPSVGRPRPLPVGGHPPEEGHPLRRPGNKPGALLPRPHRIGCVIHPTIILSLSLFPSVSFLPSHRCDIGPTQQRGKSAKISSLYPCGED